MPNWTYNRIKCKKELGDKLLAYYDISTYEYVFDYDVRTHDDAVKQLIYDIDDYIRQYMEENPDYYDEDGEWDTAAEQQRRHDEYLAE